MLMEPTINKMLAMKPMNGMTEALEEQRKSADAVSWAFRGPARPASGRTGSGCGRRTARLPPASSSPKLRQPALRGGHRLPAPPRVAAQRDEHLAACDWVQQAQELHHHRTDRRGQKLPRLRPGPKGLPRWLPARGTSTPPKLFRETVGRPGGRQPPLTAQEKLARNQTAGDRRLGTGKRPPPAQYRRLPGGSRRTATATPPTLITSQFQTATAGTKLVAECHRSQTPS